MPKKVTDCSRARALAKKEERLINTCSKEGALNKYKRCTRYDVDELEKEVKDLERKCEASKKAPKKPRVIKDKKVNFPSERARLTYERGLIKKKIDRLVNTCGNEDFAELYPEQCDEGLARLSDQYNKLYRERMNTERKRKVSKPKVDKPKIIKPKIVKPKIAREYIPSNEQKAKRTRKITKAMKEAYNIDVPKVARGAFLSAQRILDKNAYGKKHSIEDFLNAAAPYLYKRGFFDDSGPVDASGLVGGCDDCDSMCGDGLKSRKGGAIFREVIKKRGRMGMGMVDGKRMLDNKRMLEGKTYL